MRNCRVRFNILYVPEDIVEEKKPHCCIRFTGLHYKEYMCIKSENCEVDSYRTARNLNTACKQFKKSAVYSKDSVFNEFNGGENFDFNRVLNYIPSSNVIGSVHALNPTGDLKTIEFQLKFRSILNQNMEEVREFIHEYENQMVKEGVRVETPEDDNKPDNTPIDDPAVEVTDFMTRWKGSNDKFDFEVGKAESNKYTKLATKEHAYIVGGRQIVHMKDYRMVLSQADDSYVLMKIKDGENYTFIETKRVKNGKEEEVKLLIHSDISKTFAFKKLQKELSISKFNDN